MADARILVHTDHRGVMAVTLDRPDKCNAFDEAMASRLLDIFSSVSDDVRLIVLRGTGHYFCAGFDLRSRGILPVGESTALIARLYQTIAAAPAPTLAVVQGGAAGGGLGLAAACDILIAEERARFVTPEGRHGILPAIILPYISRAIGKRQAAMMVMSGRSLSAPDALLRGLAQAVVAHDGLDRELDAWINDILSVAPSVARGVKPYLHNLAAHSGQEAANFSAAAASKALTSPDATEGASALKDGRAPRWRDSGVGFGSRGQRQSARP